MLFSSYQFHLIDAILMQNILFCRFEFVRSIGASIVPIKLQEGQQLNGKVLRHVAGTSPIYVRALEDIERTDQVRLMSDFSLMLDRQERWLLPLHSLLKRS